MIGVIADDISGAAEIAGVGLRHGLRAEVLLKGRPGKGADLVCIDTDSRFCSPREAARRTAAAAKVLQRAGAKWIYKKTDSVLRGEVAAEVLAVAKELRLSAVLLHPANPGFGRIIRGGNYFVGGKLLHKTEFLRDPAHPRTTADVCKLLDAAESASVRLGKLSKPVAAEGIVICESASAREVQAWARRATPDLLVAGGSEFFSALLDVRLPARKQRAAKSAVRGKSAAKKVPGRELFVCGTTSKSAQDFVRSARLAGTPIFSLPGELAWGADFTRPAIDNIKGKVLAAFAHHPRVILQTGLPPVQEIPVAQRLAGYLTQLAGVILKDSAVQRIYAEGGATAVELARRMGWTRLTVVREIAPGVATLGVPGRSSLHLTIKPGTYVWPKEIQTPSDR